MSNVQIYGRYPQFSPGAGIYNITVFVEALIIAD
jgi:hypothetical protein